MSDARQVQAIREEMAAIRRELRNDVDEIVEDTREMVDWRYYVREHPWACMAAVAALGYLVVPPRIETVTPDADDLVTLAKRKRLVVKPRVEGEPRGGLAGGLFNFVFRALIRSLVAYFGQQVGIGRTRKQRNKEADHDRQQ